MWANLSCPRVLLLVSLASLGSTVSLGAGCASSDSTAPAAAADSSTTLDAPIDTGVRSEAAPSDAAKEASVEAGPVEHGKTTGKACTSNDDCDVTGDGINACSRTFFSAGALYPEAVCIGSECAGGDSSSLWPCDGDRGWCLTYPSFSRCYPQCAFETGADSAPTGCVGKDVCNYMGWTTDMAGVNHGAGYCFGGCLADADCPTPQKCQRETGECVLSTKAWTATLKVGDPCTAVDRGTATKAPNCSCWMNTTVAKGYCSSFCKMGDSPSTCPAGFTCDAQLPLLDKAGKPFYTKAAKGLAGGCFKNCSTDAECEPLGGFCDETAGTGRKTCQFGKRP